MKVEEFFEGRKESKRLFDAMKRQVARLGEATIHVSKSQIAFKRKRTVAIIWVPGKYLTGHVARLVLTLSFPHRDPSSRWKQIVEVGPGRFTHHLELFKASDIDAEVRRWLQVAWDAA